MKVLLTGSSGRVGRPIRVALEAKGHSVRPFDLSSGEDVLDAKAVSAAASGSDAIVHSAGIPDDDADWAIAAQTLPVNVVGTWNVLLAARDHGVSRVIVLSSGKALGMLERNPDYVPIDDDHRGRPTLPYALSKWLIEEMCEAFSAETGVTTICLRPVLVLDPTRYPQLASGPELPLIPNAPWHLGVFVDVDDVASAAAAAVTCRDPGHARLLLCADDVGSDRSTAELLAEYLPLVPWRGAPLAPGSRRSLVDSSRAKTLLGWRPLITWNDRHARIASEG